MLKIIVQGQELFNEATNEFTVVDGIELEFEHSLLALSKWESIYEKPFLGPDEKTNEELIGYMKAMLVTPGVSSEVFSLVSPENILEIQRYIDSKQSATTFGSLPDTPKAAKEIISSELIYYWLVAFTIPFDVETWHLNRLFALIRICNIKNSKPKKMTPSQIAERNRELNAQRKAQLGTSG